MKRNRMLWLGVMLALWLPLMLMMLGRGRQPERVNSALPARKALVQVAELRREGKPADALNVLHKARKDARQPDVAAAIDFVEADIYRRDLKDDKHAQGIYGRLALSPVKEVDIPGLGRVDVQTEALKFQDEHNRTNWLYVLLATIAGAISSNPVTGGLLAAHSGVLTILLLTVAVKLALTPFTAWSFRAMAGMQKLQPRLKELQQRYKDKPKELQLRTMELYKEYGVNPFTGCLPMLLQMPIIILLYRAIGLYQYPLSKESFLWIGSLAMPDLPLALVYAASLYASSKLTMVPSGDPQQEQQQRMMAIMMPVMFFILFKGYPAGFILGWLFFNVLTTAQQWHMLRQQREKDAATGSATGTASPGGSGDPGGDGMRKPLTSGNAPARKVSKVGGPQGKAKLQTPRAIKRKGGRLSTR